MVFSGAVYLLLAPAPDPRQVSHSTISCNVPLRPPPRKVVPLTEQRYMNVEQCFDLNNSDDDDSLFFKPSPSRHSSLMQHCHEHVEIDIQGAGKLVMVLV